MKQFALFTWEIWWYYLFDTLECQSMLKMCYFSYV